jgi:hypothetical protein
VTGFGLANPEGFEANAASIVSRRRLVRQREVSQFYVRRLLRNQLVPVGQQGTGAPATETFEKVVLQKDHLNVVGNHGTQAPGASEVEVTRDADGGMRLWATGGGGGGGGGAGGNLQWAGSWGGTIPDGIFLSQYQGAWS